MTKSILCCVASLALVAAAAPARSGEPANGKPVSPIAASQAKSAKGDCEARMSKLDQSQAEGDELLAEKDSVIGICASQYKNDATIRRLVKECQKYEEQPIVKQQFLAGCELAAFNYANVLYDLKAYYRK